MTSRFDADAAVIGASLAGASAAIRLAQAGAKVLLFDRARFPREKPCGEGLSSVGASLLSEVLPSLNTLPQSPFLGYRVVSGSKAADLAGEMERGIGIRRSIVDGELFSRATTFPSIEIHAAEGISRVSPLGTGWSIEGHHRYRVENLLIADGANSKSASTLSSLQVSSAPNNRRYSFTLVLSGAGFHDGRVTVLTRPEYEIYCTPVGGDLLNVAVLGQKHIIAPLVKTSEQIVCQVCDHYGVSLQVERGLLGAGPVSTLIRNQARTYLLGDAAEIFDPIGGMGMTHALLSAKLSAESVIKVLSAKETPESALAAYATARDIAAKPFRGVTGVSKIALTTGIGRRVISTVSDLPFLSKFAISLTDVQKSGRVQAALFSVAHRLSR